MVKDIRLDLSKVSRETALKTWLAYHRIGYRELAARIGVDPSFISYIVQGKRRSRRVMEELIAMGVPVELLPMDGSWIPGRKPSD